MLLCSAIVSAGKERVWRWPLHLVCFWHFFKMWPLLFLCVAQIMLTRAQPANFNAYSYAQFQKPPQAQAPPPPTYPSQTSRTHAPTLSHTPTPQYTAATIHTSLEKRVYEDLTRSPLEQPRRDPRSLNMLSGRSVIRRALFPVSATSNCFLVDQVCLSNTQDALPDLQASYSYPVGGSAYAHFVRRSGTLLGGISFSRPAPGVDQVAGRVDYRTNRGTDYYADADVDVFATPQALGFQAYASFGETPSSQRIVASPQQQQQQFMQVPSFVAADAAVASNVRESVLNRESQLVQITSVRNLFFGGTPISARAAALLERFAAPPPPPTDNLRLPDFSSIYSPYDSASAQTPCRSYRTLLNGTSYCVTNAQWIEVSTCTNITYTNAGPNFCRADLLAFGRHNCFTCRNIGVPPQPQLISCIQATHSYRGVSETSFYSLWQCYY